MDRVHDVYVAGLPLHYLPHGGVEFQAVAKLALLIAYLTVKGVEGVTG